MPLPVERDKQKAEILELLGRPPQEHEALTVDLALEKAYSQGQHDAYRSVRDELQRNPRRVQGLVDDLGDRLRGLPEGA